MLSTIFTFIRGNIKKIALSFLLFITSMLLIIIIFFPINNIATSYIDGYILKHNMPIRYEKLNIGYFGGTISGITINNQIKIDKIAVKYNPITLLLRKINFNIISDIGIVKGKLNGNDIDADAKIAITNIANIFDMKATGTIDILLNYNLATTIGAIKLTSTSGAITFTHPLMTVEADSLSANANINGQLLKIDNLNATGKTALNATGLINFNPQNISASILDINGKVDFMGINTNFTLQGSLISPMFNLK